MKANEIEGQTVWTAKSDEELSALFDQAESIAHSFGDTFKANFYRETARRLRSITALQSQIDGMIKRPTIEVVKSVDGYYYASVNRVAQSIHVTENSAQIAVDSLHFAISKALGMEGGE